MPRKSSVTRFLTWSKGRATLAFREDFREPACVGKARDFCALSWGSILPGGFSVGWIELRIYARPRWSSWYLPLEMI
jgi:hypothetical protein